MHATDGLEPGERLPANEGFGTAWTATDQRLGPDRTTRRIVRELSKDSCGAAWNPVRDRVARLRSAGLPFVVPIREAVEADGTLRIVCDAPRSTVADELKPDRAFADAVTVRSVARSLLRGLEALHAAGLAHGDLRPTTIHLSHAHDGARRTAWLADAATGGMACWTQGGMLLDESRAYWPPESVLLGQAPETKPRHDFHALGLLLCEMLAGTQANPLRKGQPVDASVLKKTLHEHKVPSALRQGILRLLRADEHAAARDFLPDFQEPRTGLEHAREAVLPAVVVTFAIGGLVWTCRGWEDAERRLVEANEEWRRERTTLSGERENLSIELNKARGAMQGEERQVHDLRKTIGERDKRIESLEGKVLGPGGGPLPPSPEELAKARWRTIRFTDSPPFGDDLKSAQKVHDDWLSEKAPVPSPEAVKHFREWSKTVQELTAKHPQVLALDPTSQDDYRKARNAPWDAQSVTTARSTLQRAQDGYDAAVRRWIRWADDDGIDDATILAEMAATEGLEKSLLRKWYDATSVSREYEVRLHRGMSPPGHGTERTLTAYSGGGESEFQHTWDTEISHVYDPGDVVAVSWKRGEGVQVVLEADSTLGVRPNRIDISKSGRFALWRLHQAGCIKSGDWWVELSVPDCPGPPITTRVCP